MPNFEPRLAAQCLPPIESARTGKLPSEGSKDSMNTGSAERSNTSERRMLSLALRRSLWTAMADIYGHRWTSSFGDNPDDGAALTWGKVLADMTPQQLATGLVACGSSAEPWPPTLPEFRAMCLAIPSLHAVRCELQSRTAERTRFVLLVWQHLDSYRWRHADARDADRMLRDAYQAAKQHVMAGGALPEAPAGAIEQQAPSPPKPADPEKVRQHLAELAALLNRSEEDEDQENREP